MAKSLRLLAVTLMIGIQRSVGVLSELSISHVNGTGYVYGGADVPATAGGRSSGQIADTCRRWKAAGMGVGVGVGVTTDAVSTILCVLSAVKPP